MALLIRLRPVGPVLRSLMATSHKTFTSRAYAPSQSSLQPSTSLFSKRLAANYHMNGQLRSSSTDAQPERDPAPEQEDLSVGTTIKTDDKIDFRLFERAFQGFEDKTQRLERVSERDFVKLFDFFTRSVRPDLPDVPIYINILIRCCGRLMIDTPPKGRELLVGNLWTFVKEKSLPLDISHYNSLLRVMNENETTYDPKKILEEIQEQKLTPDRITYQRLIHQYCMQADIGGATNLLEKMKNLGMELSESTFASLVLGYFKQENHPNIKEMFELMRSNGVEPNSGSYTAAFVSLASKIDKDPNAIDQLKELFELYKKDDVQIGHFDQIELITHLTPLKSKHEIIDQILKSTADNLSGNLASRYRTLTALIRLNELERASQLFWSQKVTERALSSGAIGSYYIRTLATNRNVPIDFAINECKRLKEQEYNFKPFHLLYLCAAENGRLDLIRVALNHMTQTEPMKVHYLWPLLAQSKDKDELIQVLKQDLNPDMNPNDLLDTFSMWVWPKFSDETERLFELNKDLKYDSNILVTSYFNYSVQENKLEEAIKFISEAPANLIAQSPQEHGQQDMDEEGHDDEPEVTRRQNRSERGDLVSRLLNQIVDQTKDPELVKKAFNMCHAPGQPVSNRSLSCLIRVHLANNDYDTALEEFIRINREYRVSPCRAELMRHCLETKNPERLQKIVNCITENFGEQNALFDLAVCCLKSNKLKQAQKVFASPGFRVRPSRVYRTCRLIAAQSDVDLLENFVSLVRDMHEVDQEYLYQILIDTYERTSNAKRALHLWNMMQEEDFQPSKRSLLMIANILEKNNVEVPFQKPRGNFPESKKTWGYSEPRKT